jgi:hypothetical protein
MNPVEVPFQMFSGARPAKKESWMGPPTPEKVHVGVLEKALRDRFVKVSLDRVCLVGTIHRRHVILLAARMTRMWEYTGITVTFRYLGL